MRPIQLRFKGLNNYGSEQKIDFEKLTEQGLFGIFGPTGSGKSTLLDAMTLVLYGEISRKSKEYINTNCDEVSVDFTFVLESKEGPVGYRVERVIKRTKSGGNQSRYARLTRLYPTEEILAERPSELKEQVVNLLGLTMEDFTRSVVLPQGKFSEFLKLKGKDRRVMLERIFGLEKYGIGLNYKLRSKYNEKRGEQKLKEELLGRFEGLSEEGIKEHKESLSIKKNEAEATGKQLKEVTIKYEKAKEVWTLQEELKKAKNALSTILEKEEEICDKKHKAERGEKAKIVLPYIKRCIETEGSLKIATEERDELIKNYGLASQSLTKYKDKLEQLEAYEKQVLPTKLLKEKSLEEAVETQDEMKKNKSMLVVKERELAQSVKQKEIVEKEIEAITENHSILEKRIADTDIKIKKINIHPEQRRLVQEGYTAGKERSEIEKNKMAKESFIKEISQELGLALEKSQNKIQLHEDHKKELDSITERMKVLEGSGFADYADVGLLQQELNSLKDKEKEVNHLKEEQRGLTEKNKKMIIIYEKLLGEEREHLEVLKAEELELIQIKTDLEVEERAQVAATLAETLTEGVPCPVCGSHHHEQIAEFGEVTILAELKMRLEQSEKSVNANKLRGKEIEIGLRNATASLEELEEKQSDLLKLRSKIGIKEELDNLQQTIIEKQRAHDQRIKEKDEASTEYKKLKELYQQSNQIYQEGLKEIASLEEYRKQKKLQIALEKNHIEKLKVQAIEVDGKLDELFLKVEVSDFITARAEIQIKDKKLLELKRDQDQLMSLEKQLVQNLNNLKQNLTSYMVQSEKEKGIKESLENEITGQLQRIKKVVGNQDPITLLEALQQEINSYRTNEKIIRKKYQYSLDKEQSYRIEQEKKKEEVSQLTSQGLRQLKDKEEMLKNYQVIEEHVDKDLLTEEELTQLKTIIESYDQQVKKTLGYVNSIEMKLGADKVTEDEYKVCENLKQELSERKEALIKEIGQVELSIIHMEKSYEEMKDLIKEKKSIDKEIALLEELTKMFKGNRFVEYVAKNQFKYILAEASKRLYTLSGRYGLEVNDDGEFMIRDDKLGGVRREAATLSGGETFLTSLALALALSSHIQLKGSYPLEFFFLDEGFGTLDTELLDTVMESLESLNHGKMSVGIISHVEELKDRVPIKLIVEPKEFDGSKIRMEHS